MRAVRFLRAAYEPAAGGVLIASFDVGADTGIVRAFVRGPAATLRLYLGNELPLRLLDLPQNQVDYTVTGGEDYASWNPPLELAAGWLIAFVWDGPAVDAASEGTVRLEYADLTDLAG